jgi:hypothetical protein
VIAVRSRASASRFPVATIARVAVWLVVLATTWLGYAHPHATAGEETS